MSSDRIDAESKVSGSQANIPARIRRALDIDDGDQLRWHLEDDAVRVHVVQRQTGMFADFDGDTGAAATDVTSDHDAWGVDANRKISSVNQNETRSGDLSPKVFGWVTPLDWHT